MNRPGQVIAFRNPRRDLSQSRKRRYLRLGQYLCLLIAALFLGRSALGYLRLRAVQLYDTWEFNHGFVTETASLERQARPNLRNPVRRLRPGDGDVLGKLEIPRIGISAIVLQGDDDDILGEGVGHVPSSALPGEMGNVAVAAHRDTLFRGLRNIRLGDDISFATASGVYRYRVESMAKVSPNDVQVLNASAAPTLTLITCYPFSFVGHAPLRFVVKAVQVDAPQNSIRQDLVAESRLMPGAGTTPESADSSPTVSDASSVAALPPQGQSSDAPHDVQARPDFTASVTPAAFNEGSGAQPVEKLEASVSPQPARPRATRAVEVPKHAPQIAPASHEEAAPPSYANVDGASHHSHETFKRIRSWLGSIPDHFKKERVETPASD